MSESSLARSLFSGKVSDDAKKPPLRKKIAKKTPQDPQNVVEGLAHESESKFINTENISPKQTNSVDSLDSLDLVDGLDSSVNSLIEDSGQSIEPEQAKQISHPKPELEPELKVMREEITIMRSHYENEFKQKNEYIAQLELEIEKLEQELTAIGTKIASPNNSVVSDQAEQIRTLEQQNQELNSCLDLVKVNNDELSAKFNQQFATLTVLQQSLTDSEQSSKRSQVRVAELEERVAELQEQVLKQAGKASEYEAAIQHWKEQSLNHQRRALHLSGALEKLLDQKPPRAGLPATANMPHSAAQPVVRTVAKVAPIHEMHEPEFADQPQQSPNSAPVYRPLAPYQTKAQVDRQEYQSAHSSNGANGLVNRVPTAVGANQNQAQKPARKIDLPSFLIRKN